MSFSVRRRRRGAVALIALTLPAFAACEDPPVFTEPEDVTFTAVAIDKATVRPREGERLTVGPTPYELELDIVWQNLPSASLLGVWLETFDSVTGQTFRWEGDLQSALDTLTSASGETRFTSTFTLPEVSPFCGSYDYLRILAVVFPGGDPPPNEAYRDEVFYEVSGSDWTGPCVSNVFSIFPGADYRIGEPVVVYGRNLPNALDVSLPGAQQDDNVWPGFIRVPEAQSLLPVPNDGYMIAFIPIGAESGRLRAFAGATEVRYGPDGDVTLPINASDADVFEPNNTPGTASDSIYFDFWDPFGSWGAYGYNPSLTLNGADRAPDPDVAGYGQGDWFFLFGVGGATTEIDVCIRAASHVGDADDLDLIVYDTAGVIVAQGATASGTEAVRVDDVSGTDVYWVWVTPYLAAFSSTMGGYSYEVGPCAGATGTAIDRPDGPFGFFGSSGATTTIGTAASAARDRQHAVRVIGGDAARVPLSELRLRGGDR